jgi:hypothetical protein
MAPDLERIHIFEILARQHEPMLLAYVLSFVPQDRHLAEDIVQNTFLIAYRKISALRDLLVVPTNVTATISFSPEQTRIQLQGPSQLQVGPLMHGKELALKSGRLEAWVAHQRPFRSMILRTPQAEAKVLGTHFSLGVNRVSTRLEVFQGKVGFRRATDGATVRVASGEYAVASSGYKLMAQPLTGRILREYWTNLPGEYYITFLTSDPDFPRNPSGRDYLDRLETPSHWAANYGARIRGYLHPPVTGSYTFWIAASDGAELWFSQDDNPGNRQQIASAEQSGPREWTKMRKQQSATIPLVAGRKYYIEVLQKQGKGEDYLAVAWQGPGRDQQIIPGEFLSETQQKEGK